MNIKINFTGNENRFCNFTFYKKPIYLLMKSSFFLFSLISFCLLTSCYNVERNCSNFKTGTFEFKYILNGKEYTNRFIRNDSLEIAEINQQKDTSTVRWINDCEFIVKKLNPTTISEQKAVHMKILSTTKNSYTFEYAIVGDQKNKQRGKATKISN